MSKRFMGVIAVLDKPTVDGRIMRYPNSGLRHRQLPLPLTMRLQLTGQVGQPVEEFMPCGLLDAIYLRGHEVVGEGVLDVTTEAGASLHNWMKRPGVLVHVAVELDTYETPLPFQDTPFAALEMLTWTIGSASLVQPAYAPWPEAVIYLVR